MISPYGSHTASGGAVDVRTKPASASVSVIFIRCCMVSAMKDYLTRDADREGVDDSLRWLVYKKDLSIRIMYESVVNDLSILVLETKRTNDNSNVAIITTASSVRMIASIMHQK